MRVPVLSIRHQVNTRIICNWACSWDYGTDHIGDQRRLRRACASAQSRQSMRFRTHEVWKLTKDATKKQTSSPSRWLRMRVLRLRLRGTKRTIISWVGSIGHFLKWTPCPALFSCYNPGKCCGHDSSFIYHRILIKLAGNKDRHKISDEFDFRPYRNISLGSKEISNDQELTQSGPISCPWAPTYSSMSINFSHIIIM